MEERVEPILMDSRRFCKANDVSATTFYRWVRLPDFPVIRVGKKLLVPVDEYREWLRKNKGKQTLPLGVNGKNGEAV